MGATSRLVSLQPPGAGVCVCVREGNVVCVGVSVCVWRVTLRSWLTLLGGWQS